jgi:hypothetical protein
VFAQTSVKLVSAARGTQNAEPVQKNAVGTWDSRDVYSWVKDTLLMPELADAMLTSIFRGVDIMAHYDKQKGTCNATALLAEVTEDSDNNKFKGLSPRDTKRLQRGLTELLSVTPDQ